MNQVVQSYVEGLPEGEDKEWNPQGPQIFVRLFLVVNTVDSYQGEQN